MDKVAQQQVQKVVQRSFEKSRARRRGGSGRNDASATAQIPDDGYGPHKEGLP